MDSTTPIVICPNGTSGEVVEIGDILIALPAKPKSVYKRSKKKSEQYWERLPIPEEIRRIKSMDEWLEMPREFRSKYSPYIEEEFKRRRDGFWFMNNGVATYITGRHYMTLQWSRFDIGSPDYLDFQRKIFIHFAACESDSRCIGQLYVKCRRSGYTNICSSILLDEGTQVKDKLLGIQSKTAKDAQENIFMKKIVQMHRAYPFFFKPIQDGTTNPRMELAFREPSKRITKNNKTSQRGEALNTVINWKATTNNAYDGEKLHLFYLDEAGKWEKPTDIREAWRIQRTCLIVGRKIVGKALVGSTVNPMDKGGEEFKVLWGEKLHLFYLDEAGKWEKPTDIREAWRIQRTCLIVGRKIVGKALVGSTVNPMDKGGEEFKVLWGESNPLERNQNGRTKSGLYRLFVPAYDSLEGFFDKYGLPIVDDPESPVETIDGDFVEQGAKTYLKNETAVDRDWETNSLYNPDLVLPF